MIKRKDILFILWITFFTVFAWVGFHIYHIAVTSTISEDLQMQIKPISPDFDMNTINKLKSREKVEPLYQFSEPTPEIITPEAAVPSNEDETNSDEAIVIENTPNESQLPQESATP